MDFPTSPEIINELKKRVENGIFRYPYYRYPPLLEAIKKWIKDEYSFDID